jgi:hypothetical protein
MRVAAVGKHAGHARDHGGDQDDKPDHDDHEILPGNAL